MGTVDEVVAALDEVVAHCVGQGSRLGYFAAVYRTVTAKIHEGIMSGLFDDGERMARLDVVFANRYLAAMDGWQRHQPVTRSWEAACSAAGRWPPLVLQHLVVGINAHINLDLGIACAEVAPGAALPTLRRDFDRINEILALLLRSVLDRIGRISPWIRILDWAGGRSDDELIKFSIEVARTQAWGFARELAPLPRSHWGGPIGACDTRVARLTGVILGQPYALLIRGRESNDVRRNIQILGAVPGPDLGLVEERTMRERASSH